MIFDLFKKKDNEVPPDYSLLKVDIHSHLLPGIDDGAATMNDAIELISGLEGLGYSRLITTPHIRGDMFPNTPDIIRRKLNEVRNVMKKKRIAVELEAAAEYFLDDYVIDLVRNKQPLLTISGNMVLVEFPFLHQPINLKELVFELLLAGYSPIIAHPERYGYFHKKYELLHSFKENGCLFQMNMLSLTGNYGKVVKDMAGYLIENDFYRFIGTDLHHHRHLYLLTSLKMNGLYHKLFTGRLLNSTL